MTPGNLLMQMGFPKGTAYRYLAQRVIRVSIDEEGYEYLSDTEIEIARAAAALRKAGCQKPLEFLARLRQMSTARREATLKRAVVFVSGGRRHVAEGPAEIPLTCQPHNIQLLADL